jgi:hypothetical protein
LTQPVLAFASQSPNGALMKSWLGPLCSARISPSHHRQAETCQPALCFDPRLSSPLENTPL